MIKEPTAVICLSGNNGGMEIDAIKLSKKLSTYTKTLLIAKTKSYIAESKNTYIEDNNIALETVSFKTTMSFNIVFTVRNLVKKYGIKNVIFFGSSELKSLYFSFLGLDINLIVRHGTTKSTPKKDWFHKLIYSDVNYHVSICKHLQKNVRTIIPFGKNTQEKLIYSSLNFSKNNEKTTHDKINLLHVGRVVRGKGQIEAIKACEVLFNNSIDFEFFIVGSIEESFENEFLEFYNNCEYKEKINLVGFTTNVQEYIEKSDIFIFPSYGEGLSNAFIEAISNNLICICFNNTSFPELRDLGLYFRIAGNKDVADLKKNLSECVNNLELEKDNAKQNSTICKEVFSLDSEMNKYLSILK